MQPIDRVPLGHSGVEVTRLGFGGAPLGNMYAEFSDAEAVATVRAAHDAGLNLFDTSPLYGHGLSEHRLGAGLRGLDPSTFVVCTKVGRLLVPDRTVHDDGIFVRTLPFALHLDYSAEATRRSLEDSLQRLGVAHVDVALVHDIDRWAFPDEAEYRRRLDEVLAGALPALVGLRSAGAVGAVGLGVNQVQPCLDVLDAGVPVDCFLLAGRYTLLEQGPLDDLLPRCADAGVSIILGGPYNTGILATGVVDGATFDYEPAPPHVLDRVRRMETVCRDHGVPLASVALRFPLGHPAVASVIPGARTPDEVRRNVATFSVELPPGLWDDLRSAGLLRPDAPTPP